MNLNARPTVLIPCPVRRGDTAFTMVEVALSLAIVAFAMVAIIGVMPAGLNVQKENRQDTIVAQDAVLFMEAIRGGQNSSNLTVLFSNLVQPMYGVNLGSFGAPTNALEVVKRLCIPDWDTNNCRTGITATTSARFRALSGNLGDSATAASNVAFNYYVTAQVTRFTNASPYDASQAMRATNLHEVKLTFIWPVFDDPGSSPPTRFGNGRLVVRTLVSGQLANSGGGYLFRSGTLYGQ